MKQTYTEPQTDIRLVEMEGFICVSVLKMSYDVEIDEEDTVNEELIGF